eukprot:CFRG4016T1
MFTIMSHRLTVGILLHQSYRNVYTAGKSVRVQAQKFCHTTVNAMGLKRVRQIRTSQLFMRTSKDEIVDATVSSHKLLLRAGYIRQTAAGIYVLLPLAHRMLEKIERVIAYELDIRGSSRVSLPCLHPAALWEKSGRWEEMGPELMRLKDRRDNGYCLGPTHEEVITDLVASELQTFRQLPIRLYQIDRKFRDEIRPRFGLIRAREFWMKDLYSFDKTVEEAKSWYHIMLETYKGILDRFKLRHVRALADSGTIGGSLSHEFHVISEIGEDNIVYCQDCGYAANEDMATGEVKPFDKNTPTILPLRFIPHAVDSETFKAVKAAAMLPYGRTLNTARLPVPASVNGRWTVCSNWERKELVSDSFSTWFVDDNVPDAVYIENISKHSSDITLNSAVIQKGHYCLIESDDNCSICSGDLKVNKGIEVGHAFYLGTKYSKMFDCTYKDENNQKNLVEMGCYGLGVTRIMSALIENNHDQRGLLLPEIVVPYLCCIVPLGNMKNGNAGKLLDIADVLHLKLVESIPGLDQELVVDDRTTHGTGSKLADSELVGYAMRVVLGNDKLLLWNENHESIAKSLADDVMFEVSMGREKRSMSLTDLRQTLAVSYAKTLSFDEV